MEYSRHQTEQQSEGRGGGDGSRSSADVVARSETGRWMSGLGAA